uniref:Uncharacterized protein n=1 Tax=Arundo donax TaxID=35708 RepID=A0A0A9CL01_ARUDO
MQERCSSLLCRGCNSSLNKPMTSKRGKGLGTNDHFLLLLSAPRGRSETVYIAQFDRPHHASKAVNAFPWPIRLIHTGPWFVRLIYTFSAFISPVYAASRFLPSIRALPLINA